MVRPGGGCWWIGLGDGDGCGCGCGSVVVADLDLERARSSVTPMLWGVVIVSMVHVCLETEVNDVDDNYNFGCRCSFG